jgi:hypothetical protein
MAPTRTAANTPGGRTLAQWYCLLGGAALLLAGLAGFIADATFGTGDSLERGKFILFDVNGWHNVVHILSGLLGLSLAGSWFGARLYAIGFGATYLVVAAIGFAVGDGESILGLIPVNTADNWLHVAIAVLGLVAGAITPSAPAPSTVGRKSPAAEPSVKRVAEQRGAV